MRLAGVRQDVLVQLGLLRLARLIKIIALARQRVQLLHALFDQRHHFSQRRALCGGDARRSQPRGDQLGQTGVVGGLDMLGVQPEEFFLIEAAGRRADRFQAEPFDKLVHIENSSSPCPPAQPRQVVEQRLGQNALCLRSPPR